jgi:hypothetical protein
MKIQFLFSMVAALAWASSFGQSNTASADIDVNNVNARVQIDINFMDPTATGSHFEVPAGGGKMTIFASSLWIGGYENNKLHIAAMTYRQQGGVDFYAGPLDTVYGNIDESRSQSWDKIWTVTKKEIDNFKKTGTATTAITSWPAHGNTTLREAKYLAPFVDVDNDGLYKPSKGDYPAIRGDKAAWWVFNDMLYERHTETNGLPLGIEVHALAYAFDDPFNPALDNTIFIDYKIINKSKYRYDSLYAGIWTDFDIGYPFDDYVGSNPAKSYYFAYNGDTYDEGIKGYGSDIPMQAVAFLKDPMSVFAYYSNDFSYKGNPTQADHYYRYLAGRYTNGDCFRRCDTCRCTKYCYPGAPQDTLEWSEPSSGIKAGDRRGLGSVGPFTLKPGGILKLPIAYITSSTTYKNGRPDRQPLDKLVDNVRTVHQYLSVEENRNTKTLDFSIYPNPAREKTHLTFQEQKTDLVVSIMDMPGRTVYTHLVPPGVNHALIATEDLKPGIYIMKLSSGEGTAVKQLIINR